MSREGLQIRKKKNVTDFFEAGVPIEVSLHLHLHLSAESVRDVDKSGVLLGIIGNRWTADYLPSHYC